MKLLYIIAPYRADKIYRIKRNIDLARFLAQMHWQKGYAVICPHMNSAMFDGLVPDETFLEAYLEILKRCDCVAVHPLWKESAGSKAEVALAKELNLEIFYHNAYLDIE